MSNALWRIKEGVKGALAVAFGGLIHTPIHEWLHWIPAKALGLNPSDIVIRPFTGGYINFSYDSPFAAAAVMLPMWILIPLGLVMIIKGWRERKTLMTGIGLVFLFNELIYQTCFANSDLWKLGVENGILSFAVTLGLIVIGYLVTRKNNKNEGRPSLFRRAVQSLRALRLPACISKRRKPKNHRKKGQADRCFPDGCMGGYVVCLHQPRNNRSDYIPVPEAVWYHIS